MDRKCTDTRIGKSIALYECGALDKRERRAFLDHLIDCEYCYDQVYNLEPVMNAFRDHRNAERAGRVRVARSERSVVAPIRTWRFPVMVAASILVALSALVFLVFLRGARTGTGDDPPVIATGNPNPWESLEIPKAAYVPPSEQVILRTPIKAFSRAMTAYQADNFEAAAEQLEALNELEPSISAEASFYLGVSLLKTGRSHDAISPLKRVVELSKGARQEAGHYYLGLAYLKRNQPQLAIAEFDSVIAANSAYRSDAKRLRQSVIESLE